MKKLLISLLFFININVYSQLVSGQFLIGGTQEESSSSTIQLSDGDYLFCGTTKSYGIGGQDLLLIRFNPDFSIDWQKTIGGSLNDFLNNMTQSVENSDGSIMVLGNTKSYGMGNVDVLLLKISSTGNVIWSKVYGGIKEERACVIRSTLDGGFIFSGSTDSYNTPTSTVTERDLFLVKLDWLGNVIWAKTWGTTDNNDDNTSNVSTQISEIKQLPDSSYIIGGIMEGLGSSNANSFMARINSNGTINWFKKYTSSGSAGHEVINTIVIQNSTNAFANGLTTYGSIGTNGRGLLFNFNINTGNVSWAKNYGNVSSSYNWLFKNYMESSNRFVLSMYENGSGFGDYDISCFAIDSNGVILQQKVFGTPDFDMSVFCTPTIDNGYLFSGVSGIGVSKNSYLVKTDNFWNSGCNESNITITSANITINPQNYNPTIVTSINSSSVSLTSNSLSVNIDTLCIEVISTCNQGSVTTFQKVYGGAGNERAHSIDKTSDGGYIIAGETTSFGAGNKDWFVMKIDANGIEQWTKTFGSTSDDDGLSITIKQTSDLGYIVSGSTNSFGAGSFDDSYIIKLNNLGIIQWEKRITGSSWDRFRDVTELANGDFLLTGSAASYSAGNMDAHVVKISSTGILIWIKNLGTTFREHSQSIIELPSGNYLLSGNTNITNNSVTNRANPFLIKTSNNGTVIWSKEYNATTFFTDINETILLNDGNLLNVGETRSSDLAGHDIFLLKTDTNGTVIWSKKYGGTGNEIGVNVREKTNGEIVISAFTDSYGNANQLLLINADATGNVVWSKTYGGVNNEELDWWGKPMQLNANEEIIITGGTKSYGAGNEDVYIVKTNECGESFCNEQNVVLTTTSPNVLTSNFVVSTTVGGSLVNTTSIVNTINFTDNYLCVDTVPSLTCNLSSNFSSTSTCLGDTTYFTDLSIDSIGNIVDWQWDFGDGTTSVGTQNPQHFYTSSGNFNVTLVVTNDNNCSDSITIPVTIHSTTTSTQNLSICQGDSVLFGGQFYNVTGIYSDSLQSSFGCDSIHSLNLNVISSFQIFQNQIICQGDSIFLGGNYQFLAGIYTDSLQATSGCDSVVLTTLTINPTFTSNQNTSICQGDSILLGGSFQTTAGIYSDNYSSSNGCDSTVNTTLTIHPTEIINQNIDICQGDSILLGGAFQTSAGIYTDVYNSVLGCDSTVNTTLTIKSPSTETLNPITICDNDSALIFGVYQNIAGIYNQVIPNGAINGCDSIVYQELLINSTYEIFANKTICQGDSIFLGGSFQTSNGIYTDVYNSSLGCDSTITTTLNVVNNFLVNVNDTICQGDSIFIAGAYQSLTGTYSEILTSSAGCDSLVITNLMVDSVINLIISDDAYTSACESAELHVSGGSSYFWSPSSGLSCTNCSNPIASPFETTTYTVTDVGSNCSRNNTVTVYVQGENEIFVPNVFTPNKNGQNDGFNIKASCIKSIHKLIYNRWGMVVFESNQINEVWDGRTTSGSEVPDGTYFYIFEVTFDINNQTDAKKVFKGTVTLLR